MWSVPKQLVLLLPLDARLTPQAITRETNHALRCLGCGTSALRLQAGIRDTRRGPPLRAHLRQDTLCSEGNLLASANARALHRQTPGRADRRRTCNWNVSPLPHCALSLWCRSASCHEYNLNQSPVQGRLAGNVCAHFAADPMKGPPRTPPSSWLAVAAAKRPPWVLLLLILSCSMPADATLEQDSACPPCCAWPIAV